LLSLRFWYAACYFVFQVDVAGRVKAADAIHREGIGAGSARNQAHVYGRCLGNACFAVHRIREGVVAREDGRLALSCFFVFSGQIGVELVGALALKLSWVLSIKPLPLTSTSSVSALLFW
jgi:hypothetical protein